MSNAAIFLDTEPYDANLPRPMGRHSAGEGFLRGFLRYAEVDRIHVWNVRGRPQPELEALLERLGPPARPVNWIGPLDRPGLAEPGGVHIPTPELVDEAWARRAVGATAYSLTGVTHTISEAYILRQLASLITGPLESWDALVCTSDAGRRAVAAQLEAVADYLHERFGVSRLPPAQLVTIPLGIHPADFSRDEGARREWRARLHLPADAVAALHLGRFSTRTKMHPGPMGLALQEACVRLGRPVYWILFGGAKTTGEEDEFRAAAAAFCPDVQLRFAPDTASATRNGLLAAADVFLSLSDNVQETFGLTPVEAMAAGLPSVVSDWDGYRDTVRHGVDGFRIRTLAPRPGLGGDLAYAHAHEFMSYTDYSGAAALFTAPDVAETAEALVALFSDAGLRARMGAAARDRAASVFDWRVVVPQFQALWAELARRRAAAPPQPPRLAGGNPWRLDPFRMFAAYPTEALGPDHLVTLSRPFAPGEALERLSRAPMAAAEPHLPSADEVEAVVGTLAASPATVATLLAAFPPDRRPVVERGLLWLAKFGMLRLSGGATRS